MGRILSQLETRRGLQTGRLAVALQVDPFCESKLWNRFLTVLVSRVEPRRFQADGWTGFKLCGPTSHVISALLTNAPGVAVQADPFERQTLKPGYHVS
jgi:hypothetical protein